MQKSKCAKKFKQKIYKFNFKNQNTSKNFEHDNVQFLLNFNTYQNQGKFIFKIKQKITGKCAECEISHEKSPSHAKIFFAKNVHFKSN